MISQVEHLNQLSLTDFPEYFSSLEVPEPGSLPGLYKGYFIGPTWLRKLAKPLLVITGMGDWRGKSIDPHGNIINLVSTKRGLERKLPMKVIEQTSLIDGKPGIAFSYDASNPYPWPWVIDEMRSIGENWVLGMTLIQWGPLVRLPLPFVLESKESLVGF
jgi:hypothetical protein